MPEKIIDIKRVIASKNPKLLRFLPRFVISYLKRIIHEDKLNFFLEKHGDKVGLEFLDEALRFLNVDYEVEGLENLGDYSRYIFASNHPLGGLDGMLLMQLLSRRYGSVRVLSNDLLMNLKPLTCFFIPVNKHGSQSVENAKLIEQAYNSNLPMLYFPAGLCSRKQNGEIKDLEWKKSFIVKALEHKRHIVPVYFNGRNSNFFYNLARLRTFLGIKVNIEMLYLADEMYKQRGRTMKITIGKPIVYETFDKSKKPIWWANWVKNIAYDLGNKNKT
jgi:putative hemolysin